MQMLFPSKTLKNGQYLGYMFYVVADECKYSVQRFDVLNPNTILMDKYGGFAWMQRSPFILLVIRQIGIRLRIGSGSWK